MTETSLSPRAQLASSALFGASSSVLALEHFRVPYRVSDSLAADGFEQVQSDRTRARILWPGASPDVGAPIAAQLHWPGRPPVPLFVRVMPDRLAKARLAGQGGCWEPGPAVSGPAGQHLASIWRGDDGSIFLPFDPDEAQLNFLTEAYHEIAEGAGRRAFRQAAMHLYYRVRGGLPRRVQIGLRRAYARVQVARQFPRWPIETALHDFLDIIFTVLRSIAEEPVPRIATWPAGKSWALVLTHDVETAQGLAALDPVLDLERSLGYRSSWNFVPRRYSVTPALVDALVSDGFEIGVHGLYHDGRDLESDAVLRSRLPGMRDAAARWGAVGFRSPATHRAWDLMPQLGFEYDSSYPDTDPFEPQPGGCCSWLPFFNRDVVELPATVPQDHTLFVILRQRDERTWLRKAEFLRSRGGMALIDTHPDYLVAPEILAAYRRFLTRFVHDSTAWRALPSEVCDWWRRRASSRLEHDGASWRVRGPAAADAEVEYLPHDRNRLDPLTASAADDLQSGDSPFG
jgi:hypothetical protein